MARKDKRKNADAAEVAGSITPGDDAPPVDVQPAPGEHDGNGTDAHDATAEDAPEPIGTAEADDAPPAPVEDMPPVEVATVDAAESAPVADASGGLASLEADVLPAGDAPKAGKKSRYDTPEKKAERNRKEKEKREAKARERAGQVARATGVASRAAAAGKPKDAPVPASTVKGDTSGVDLSVLLGLSFHALSMALPEKYGGGALTPDERELLGKAWAAPLAPYLSGAAGPWAVAAISTVQVFAVRAMMYQPPKVMVAAVHSRPEVTAPAAEAPAPAPVPAPPPVKGATQQEPGVGEA